MKKIILSAIVALTMASGVAMGASDFDYQGGALNATVGQSSAVSGGAGATGGVSFQGSQATSSNSTGATASEVTGPTSTDVSASTISAGQTSQDSFSGSAGTAGGSTGALTAQAGTSNASANGGYATGDLDVDGDSFGLVGSVGQAGVESKSTAGSGALTASSGNGSASYDTVGLAGNTTVAGASTFADADAGAGTTTLVQDSYAGSVGGNLNAVSGTQSGSAFGLAGSGGDQTSNAQASNVGFMVFGQAGGGENVVGGGLAGNASQTTQGSTGLVFGLNNGDAISTTGTLVGNTAGSGLQGVTTADNSLTTINTSGYEVGTANALTLNANTPGDSFNANLGGNATEFGIGGAGGAFTTLP